MSATAGYLELIVDSTSVAQGERALDNIARTGSRTEKSMKGNMGQIERAMARLGQQSTKIDKTLNASLSQTAAISKTVARGLASLAAGITSVAAIKQAVTEARNFNAALAETSTLIDGTPAQMEALRASAMDLTRAYGGSSTAQVKAFYQAISAGADSVEAAARILDQANKLAIGGVTDVTTGVDGLTTAINAYAATGLTAAEASDVMFIGMRAGKTTIGELSAQMGQIVPIASAAGVSFDEMIAAVSALTTQGQSTAMATTGLRAAITGILQPSKQASDAAKALGLEFSASALQAKGLEQFMADVVQQTGGSTDAMTQLFGSVEALNSALAFSGAAGQNFTDIMAEMAEKAGATDEAFGKVADSLDKRMSFAFGKIGALVTQFGTAILTIAVPALEAMAAGAEFLSQNFDSVTGVVITSATALTAYYSPAIIAAAKATGVWVASLVTLKGALIATGIGALVVGAGILVGQILKLVRVTGGWGNALTLLGQVASGVWDGIKTSASAIPVALGSVWELIKSDFLYLMSELSAGWRDFLISVGASGDAANAAVTKYLELSNDAAVQSGKLAEAAKNLATGGFDKASEAAAKLRAQVEGTADSAGAGSDAADELARSLAKVDKGAGKAGKALDEAKSEAEAFAEALVEAADSAEDLGTKKAGILVGGIDGISNAWGDFVSRGFSDFSGFVDSVLDGFKGMLSEMIALAARNRIMLSLGISATGTGTAASAGSLGGAGFNPLGLLGNAGSLFGSGGIISGIGSGLGGVFSGGGLGSSFANLGGLLTGASGGWGAIGAALPAVGLLAGIPLLIKGLSRKYAGSGIRGSFGADGFDGSSIDFYKGGFLRSNKTVYKDLDAELESALDQSIAGMVDGLETMSAALGLGTKSIADFNAEGFTIWTNGKSQEQIMSELQDQMLLTAEGMAELILTTDKFSKVGETAYETITRLGTGLLTANDAFDLLGRRQFGETLLGGHRAADLVSGFGGAEQFNAIVSGYFSAFYTESEQLEATTRRMAEQFSELGFVMPETRDGFRDLVEAQRLGTKEGRETYASLLSLAAGFDQLITASEGATVAVDDVAEGLSDIARQQRTSLRRQLLTLLGRDGKLRQMELRALDPANRALQERIWAIQDEQEAIAEARAERQAEREEAIAEARAERQAEREEARAIRAERQAEREEARAIRDERRGLREQLWELLGKTDRLRARELAGLDASNRALQERIWRLEDEQALISSLNDGVSAAMSAVSDAIGAEIGRIGNSAQEQIDRLSDDLSAASARADAARSSVIGFIDEIEEGSVGAFRRMRDEIRQVIDARGAISEAQELSGYRAAQAQIIDFATGQAITEDALSRALGGLQTDSSRFFGSFSEYAFDTARTTQTLRELEAVTGDQLTEAEQQVAALRELYDVSDEGFSSLDAAVAALESETAKAEQLEREILTLEEWRDTQIEALEAQLTAAQEQADAALGISSALVSVAAALSGLNTSIGSLGSVTGGMSRDQLRTAAITGQTGNVSALWDYEQRILGSNRGDLKPWETKIFDSLKLQGFSGGGFTGWAPRSGGLDGEGGFLAMLHPRETVVDHHKGQGMGDTMAILEELKALRKEVYEVKAHARQTNINTGQTARTQTDWDRNGLPAERTA